MIDRVMEVLEARHTGTALLNFLEGVDCTHTSLGEYSSSKKNGPLDIVASGHRIYELESENAFVSPGVIYTKASGSAKDISKVFNYGNGSNLDKALNVAMEYRDNLTDEDKQKLLTKLNNINTKKELIIPFKPKTNYKLTYVGSDGKKKKNILASVDNLTWRTNQQTYKLGCEVTFNIESKEVSDKKKTFNVQEFCRSFLPEQSHYWQGLDKADVKCLNITNLGIISPIMFTNGIHSVMVDGTYIYWIYKGKPNVIGEWRKTGELSLNSEFISECENSVVYKDLMTNLPLITKVRHLIAPYNTMNIFIYNGYKK